MNIFFKKFAVQIFVVLFILFVLLLISSIAPFSAVGTQAVLNKKNRSPTATFPNGHVCSSLKGAFASARATDPRAKAPRRCPSGG